MIILLPPPAALLLYHRKAYRLNAYLLCPSMPAEHCKFLQKPRNGAVAGLIFFPHGYASYFSLNKIIAQYLICGNVNLMRLKNREQRQTEKTGLRFSSQTCLEYFLSCVAVFAAEKFSADCCQGVFRALRAQFNELFYKQNQHNYYKHNTEHLYAS